MPKNFSEQNQIRVVSFRSCWWARSSKKVLPLLRLVWRRPFRSLVPFPLALLGHWRPNSALTNAHKSTDGTDSWDIFWKWGFSECWDHAEHFGIYISEVPTRSYVCPRGTLIFSFFNYHATFPMSQQGLLMLFWHIPSWDRSAGPIIDCIQ